jgi:hypothetical protein
MHFREISETGPDAYCAGAVVRSRLYVVFLLPTLIIEILLDYQEFRQVSLQEIHPP